MDIEGLTNKEIRACIITALEEKSIPHEMISISVVKGPKVMLSGEVYTEEHRSDIVDAVIDTTGLTKIINSIEIIKQDSALDDEIGSDVFDDDNDCMGTEDVSRAVEDGLPYIPPDDGWSFDDEK
ncbi:MAG: BON domain-containing protein [Candidatus Omnitrophica bacterium]|nr:BON domain-containing protein [Candidatus Omnitrophota bacterium]